MRQTRAEYLKKYRELRNTIKKVDCGEFYILEIKDRLGRCYLIEFDYCDLETISARTWSISNTGYARCSYNGRGTLMHRVILQHDKNECIDHLDRNKLNNRRSNLAGCTRQENNTNSIASHGGSSKYRGVFWSKKANRWLSKINHKGKTTHIGTFKDEESAYLAYLKARTIIINT